MADVMDAFLRGHQAGQQEVAQQQEQAERNLRQMVLKHELSRMKVEDAAKDYQAQFGASEAQYRGLHGQPAASIPSDPITTQQPNLPSRNLAGVVTGMMQGQPGIDSGSPAPVSSSTPPTMPAASLPAPLAQDQATGTNPVTRMVPRAVTFPGLPPEVGGGSPGFSLRPQSAEDLQAATAATKAAEPYDLAPGAQRQIGGRVVGTNTTPRLAPAPSPEALANDEANRKAAAARNAATVAARGVAAKAAADERDRRTQWEQDFRQHNAEQSRQTAEFLHAHQAWQVAYKRANPYNDADPPIDPATGKPAPDFIDPVTKKPVGQEPVAPVPQSFEDYQAAKAPKAATPAPAARAASGHPDGTAATINGKPSLWRTIPGKGSGWIPVGTPYGAP